MPTHPPTLVITSIAAPGPILRSITQGCASAGWGFVLAGDRKSPDQFELPACTFLNLESQRRIAPRYGPLCPENSYVRKNIAYIEAVRRGAPSIVETDDDNLPETAFWRNRESLLDGDLVEEPGWTNAYRFFSDGFFYPRGFPLDAARASQADAEKPSVPRSAPCPVQQGLVQDQPDVDALYRLLIGDAPPFQPHRPVILGANVWCPFNSQNTFFSSEAFPLLYLPATCTFRATDIWRGHVAQRLLWTCGWHLAFVEADVRQIRNPHHLLSDLELEIPVYLQSRRVAEILEQLDLARGPVNLPANLVKSYEALASHGIVGPEEPALAAAWLEDLTAAGWAPTHT